MKMSARLFPLLMLAILLATSLIACQEPLEHVHDIVTQSAVEPTCTSSGHTEGQRCRSCGQVILQVKNTPALGHTLTEDWVIDRPATETLAGEMSLHCTVCGEHTAITAIPRLVPPTEGLRFELTEQGDAFVCVGLLPGVQVTELHIPSSHLGLPVVAIEARAFMGNATIESLIVPESIREIGKSAFSDCAALRSIQLPDTVKYIADNAFYGTSCYNNASLWQNGALYLGDHLIAVRPATVKGLYTVRPGTVTVSGAAFYGCTELTEIVLPHGVVSIGNSAFYGCKALRTLHLPDSLEIIGNGALAYCSALTEFTLPVGVREIKSNPFPGCNALQRITVAEGNPVYHSDGNCMIETAEGRIVAGCLTSKIPSDGSVRALGTAAFYECGSLVSLTLPEGIEEIGTSAFHECVNLREIVLPSTLRVIGQQAFRGCSALTEITLPVGVETLEEGAFCYCEDLVTIHLPEGLTDIAPNTFAYCYDLRELVLPSTLRSLGTNALEQCNQLKTETYGNCRYLGDWLIAATSPDVTEVTLKPTTVGIYAGAFSGCYNLTEIDLPSSVRFIGQNAFLSCWRLTELRIPEGVTELPTKVFAYCSYLKTLHLPLSIETIATEALLDCTALTVIDYAGSTQQWIEIDAESGWDKNTGNYALISH